MTIPRFQHVKKVRVGDKNAYRTMQEHGFGARSILRHVRTRTGQ